MNTINPIHSQQPTRINNTGALRQAASNTEIPKLTKDESSLIQEKFMPSKTMNLYTVNGRMDVQTNTRGLNLDTRA